MGLMPSDKVRRYTAEMIVALHGEIGLLQRQVASLNTSNTELRQSVTMLSNAIQDLVDGKRRLLLPTM